MAAPGYWITSARSGASWKKPSRCKALKEHAHGGALLRHHQPIQQVMPQHEHQPYAENDTPWQVHEQRKCDHADADGPEHGQYGEGDDTSNCQPNPDDDHLHEDHPRTTRPQEAAQLRLGARAPIEEGARAREEHEDRCTVVR